MTVEARWPWTPTPGRLKERWAWRWRAYHSIDQELVVYRRVYAPVYWIEDD